MSTTAEDLPQLWRPGHGDLVTWYRTVEVYAASAPEDNIYFHGPHVAPPAESSGLEERLKRYMAEHKLELRDMPLLTLDQMRGELAARSHPSNGRSLPHPGSPLHNLWHLMTGS